MERTRLQRWGLSGWGLSDWGLSRWDRERWGLALILAVLVGTTRIRSPDVLFHLAAGRLIRAEGRVPTVDAFSFTARGAPWQNHEWLFEWVLASLHDTLGFAGVTLLQVGLVFCLSALTLRRDWLSANRAAQVTLLASALVAYREVANARPQLLSFVLTAAAIVLIRDLLRDPPIRGWLGRGAALVLLHAVWLTSHGSHPLLLGALLTAAIVALAQRRRAVAARLLGLLVAGVGLTWGLAPSALDVLSDHAGATSGVRFLGEWGPTNVQFLFFTLPGLAFTVAGWLAVSGCAARVLVKEEREGAVSPPRSGAPAWDLLFMLALVGMAFTARRFAAFFVLGGAPLWLPYAGAALARLARARALRLAPVRVGAILLTLAGAFGMSFGYGHLQLGAGLSEGRFPVAMLDWMETNDVRGRYFHPYAWGSYMMFRGHPPEGVYVDSRHLTVYADDFVTDYFLAWRDPARFDRLADRYALDGVLLPASEYGGPMARHLLVSGWRPVYRGADGAVLVHPRRPTSAPAAETGTEPLPTAAFSQPDSPEPPPLPTSPSPPD